MKVTVAIGLLLNRVVSVVDAVGQAIETTAQSATVLADAGKDMSLLAKHTTEQMLMEQQLENRKEMLLLQRELAKEISLDDEEVVAVQL
jgi:hypothetical protein